MSLLKYKSIKYLVFKLYIINYLKKFIISIKYLNNIMNFINTYFNKYNALNLILTKSIKSIYQLNLQSIMHLYL